MTTCATLEIVRRRCAVEPRQWQGDRHTADRIKCIALTMVGNQFTLALGANEREERWLLHWDSESRGLMRLQPIRSRASLDLDGHSFEWQGVSHGVENDRASLLNFGLRHFEQEFIVDLK